MIIKHADDRTADIEQLQSLLSTSGILPETQRKIEQEIKFIQAGARGEKETAYEIDFNYGKTGNWAVLHDLRIEHDGRVAQIDHLLIDRFLEMWVIEGKRFSDGIVINEQGECAMLWNDRPIGIASPYEQNEKHIIVLKSLCKAGLLELPKRLGFVIKPKFFNMVVISKNARITRPDAKGWWDVSLAKADQLSTLISKISDTDTNVLNITKVISPETLKGVAERLAALHVPAKVNWASKFGMSPSPKPVKPAPAPAVPQHKPDFSEKAGEKAPNLVCSSCRTPITTQVAQYCLKNKQRFAGGIYCRACQAKVESGNAQASQAAAPPVQSAPVSEKQPALQSAKPAAFCKSCGVGVESNVARFCRFNKAKFGGNVYCMSCQKTAVAQ